ncbi:MAG TPA: hypothetical protein VFA93_00875 [Patescibacteria group bacterium]|nr:hypothetical protein [Patescibacteria group bacterium]
MSKFIVLAVILILVSGGAGFVAGSKFGRVGNGNSAQLQFRQRFGATNSRPVRGQIINADDKSITVKLQDGSTKIVLIPSSAAILKTDSASISDLKKDETVVVFGTENSDGSITAQNVQLNPRERTSSQQPTK